ncbi:MAG: AAA family ATPase, partial [Desulfobacteraceae bacterium]|nr:AAA family ATPase [Desulfobacteraceae bacterium]
MKLPYGIADFPSLRRDGHVYIDRTAHIATFEELGRSILFVRPRRFGKSLWLQTLSAYYDLGRKDQHEELFGDLAAGREPSPLAHRFFILKWNFSVIDPLGAGASDPVAGIAAELDDYVISTVEDFKRDYREILAELLPEPIQVEKSGRHTLANLLAAIRETPYKLYLMI